MASDKYFAKPAYPFASLPGASAPENSNRHQPLNPPACTARNKLSSAPCAFDHSSKPAGGSVAQTGTEQFPAGRIMDDHRCIAFLQWALPKLDFRWQGFRRVRRQVCKRIERRIDELNLADLDSYRQYLEYNSLEWQQLDRCCRVTISRFYRDTAVFDYFGSDVLPELSASLKEDNGTTLRVWSAGCASGEEPYTVAILWHWLIRPLYPELQLEIIATDIDSAMIRRAQAACYPASSLRKMPPGLLAKSFAQKKGFYFLKQPVKEYVHFDRLDIREESPGGIYHVILCRNLAFTYFADTLQRLVIIQLVEKLAPGGVLVTGTHENLPPDGHVFSPWLENMPFYRKD